MILILAILAILAVLAILHYIHIKNYYQVDVYIEENLKKFSKKNNTVIYGVKKSDVNIKYYFAIGLPIIFKYIRNSFVRVIKYIFIYKEEKYRFYVLMMIILCIIFLICSELFFKIIQIIN